MSVKELAAKYTRKFKPSIFDSGIASRLPDAYRKFYDEWRNTTPEPVHYIPQKGNIWVRNPETGEVKRVENVPLPARHPKELNSVLLGGEKIIQGFVKKSTYSTRVSRFWVPHIYKSVVYSEVLDKYLSTLITQRAIDLIHKHRGLDTYLLQTKACDLGTTLALKLKKSILLALSNKDLPYDEEKNNAIYEKYKKYLIPPEEIEWYGLNITEALNKQKEIEEAEKLASIIPLKQVYQAELIKQLQDAKIEGLNEPEKEQEEKKSSMDWLKKNLKFTRSNKKS